MASFRASLIAVMSSIFLLPPNFGNLIYFEKASGTNCLVILLTFGIVPCNCGINFFNKKSGTLFKASVILFLYGPWTARPVSSLTTPVNNGISGKSPRPT